MAESRECQCDNAYGPTYTRDQCWPCWRWKFDPIYRMKRGGTLPPTPIAPPHLQRSRPDGRPGAHLKELLSSLGFEADAVQPGGQGCTPCHDLARKMDRWGIEGCIRRREEIIAQMRENAAKYGLAYKAKAALLAVKIGLAFSINPADPIPDLFDEAIRRAKLDRPPAGKIEWVTTAQLVEDTAVLGAQLPPNVSGVVGIPRSGMIPASVLAARLQLPLYEIVPQNGELRQLGAGGRSSYGWAGDPQNGPLVVVDDTIYGGRAMWVAKQHMRRLRKKAIFTAVYPISSRLREIEYYGRILPDLQLLEWNLFGNSPWQGGSAHPRVFRAGCATDFDGILCEEPRAPDHREAEYSRWLDNARPLYLPRRHVTRLIVTGRLEKYRAQTLAWLKAWGVHCERLVMCPAKSWRERGDMAKMKADEYGRSNCGFFFESEPAQAAEIFRLTGKPVVCPIEAKVYQ